MNKKSGTSKAAATKLVKSIRRKTRHTYSAEEKIHIVLAGLRGEETISGWCQINSNQSQFTGKSSYLCRTKLTPLSESGGTV